MVFCTYRTPITSASYLDTPRIHFAGQFRVDTDTRNNVNCNFDLNNPLNTAPREDYNFNGTGEFSFFDSVVTSVVDANGVFSMDDPIVDGQIFNNDDKTFPKLADLDVDFQVLKASIFGMTFGVKWEGGSDLAFQGDWQPNILAQDLWGRSICTNVNHNYESHRFGAKSVTRLQNVRWGDVSESPVLQQLMEESKREENELSVSITVYFYTRDTPEYLFINFTLGYVVGTIGVAKPHEPKLFNGHRLLSFEGVEQPDLPLPEDDSCYVYQQNKTNHPYWMNKAPFQLFPRNKRLTVDLSNSLPVDLYGSLRHVGELRLGIINEQENCIELIGEKSLPYLEDEHWMTRTGGVVDYILNEHQFVLLNTSKLVVARVLHTVEPWHQHEVKTAAGSLSDYHECQSDNLVQIMLLENPIFIRPMDDYVTRLDYNYASTFDVSLLVTQYGYPLEGETVSVFLSNKILAGASPLPPNGVEPTSYDATTNDKGIATFKFVVEDNIPFPRQYNAKQPPCPGEDTLPIDGQVYTFRYHTPRTCVDDVNNNVTKLSCCNDIAILGFSYEDPLQPYTWVNGVEAVFKQYNHLYPVMHKVVNLANYNAIILPHNLNLITYAMNLSTSHPNYMPVTRDLSPTKRAKILKWLENPIYDDLRTEPDIVSSQCVTPETIAAVDDHEKFFMPTSCIEGFLFGDAPYEIYDYFRNIFEDRLSERREEDPLPRPLWRYNLKDVKDLVQCSPANLRYQLQIAVELEFATLPVYLTSLYSIVDGCNKEVYALIRSIIMEEMLHMTQAANILIAVGGHPQIDSDETVPTFPRTGLPGNVVPHLHITLQKASRMHVHKVFMGIEVPHNTTVDQPHPEIFNNTIGQFYKEIEACIDELTRLNIKIFDESKVKEQVEWPWDAPTVGKVYVITDATSAKAAINEIITQGEGAGPPDPTVGSSNQLAHFYRFEEIVCQHHLVEDKDAGKYTFTGAPIPFMPAGVWPMRDNPSQIGINPGHNCYTEAKAFHHTFRALLRSLQKVFSGRPSLINEAITIMESLAVHARKLMWTKFDVNANHDYTCGPVWDYHWDD